MKYLFGDSAIFNTERDFLKLLENFLDTSVEAITLENTIFDLREKIKDKRLFKDIILDDMDTLSSAVETSVTEIVSKSKEQDTLVKHAENIKDIVRSYIDTSKNTFTDDISQIIKNFEQEIADSYEKNRKMLESFFIQDPIAVIDKKYTIKIAEKGYYAYVQTYSDGISYVFNIDTMETFWGDHVKVSNFMKNVEIPAKMRKPFLKKEEAPNIANIEDYILSDVVISKNELDVILQKRIYTTSERFRIKMKFADEFTIDVRHADENDVEKNIQEVPELKAALNILRLRELGEKILIGVDNLYERRQELKSIYLNDKDILEDNLVFELMQKFAEMLTPTIAEIKDHSPLVEEELSIKEEDEHGKRREIYLKRNSIREKFSTIKDKGDKLLQIMQLNE